MKIYVGNGQFFADGFAVRRAFEAEEGERRVLSYISNRGCGCTRMTIRGGRPHFEERTVRLTKWQAGWEITPAPFSARKDYEESFPLGEGRTTLRCEAGDPTVISLVEKGWRRETYCPISDPKATLISGQREPILSLRARTESGEYLALLSLGETPRLLLEDYGDSVTCSGNDVTVVRRLSDLRHRKVVTRYLWRGNGFDRSREIICADAHPFIREEMGRLLLEAALAEDEDAVKELLSPDLADPRALLDYFGPLTEVRPPLLTDSPTAYAALKRTPEGVVATVYDFDFDEEGRITNVRAEGERG